MPSNRPSPTCMVSLKSISTTNGTRTWSRPFWTKESKELGSLIHVEAVGECLKWPRHSFRWRKRTRIRRLSCLSQCSPGAIGRGSSLKSAHFSGPWIEWTWCEWQTKPQFQITRRKQPLNVKAWTAATCWNGPNFLAEEGHSFKTGRTFMIEEARVYTHATRAGLKISKQPEFKPVIHRCRDYETKKRFSLESTILRRFRAESTRFCSRLRRQRSHIWISHSKKQTWNMGPHFWDITTLNHLRSHMQIFWNQQENRVLVLPRKKSVHRLHRWKKQIWRWAMSIWLAV